MTTGTTAIQALEKVGHDTFIANGSDPTWGTLYGNMLWNLRQPFGHFEGQNAIYLYKTGGQTLQQGLGTVKEWRYSRIRLDILCDTYANAEQTFEFLRTAWITDFNNSPAVNAVGTGYLRLTGGIKNIQIGESQSAPWETRGLVFRRIADINLEIGD